MAPNDADTEAVEESEAAPIERLPPELLNMILRLLDLDNNPEDHLVLRLVSPILYQRIPVLPQQANAESWYELNASLEMKAGSERLLSLACIRCLKLQRKSSFDLAARHWQD